MNIQQETQLKWNTNTIVALVGFAVTLLTLVITTTLTFARIQSQVEAWMEFQRRQEAHNSDTESFKKQSTIDHMEGERTQMTVEGLEKRQADMVSRVDKISDRSEAIQIELRDKLNQLGLQVSLMNQLLVELKEERRTVHGRPTE